jgi:hypothetical protein
MTCTTEEAFAEVRRAAIESAASTAAILTLLVERDIITIQDYDDRKVRMLAELDRAVMEDG